MSSANSRLGRRKVLSLLGIGATVAYTAPLLTHLGTAYGQSGPSLASAPSAPSAPSCVSRPSRPEAMQEGVDYCACVSRPSRPEQMVEGVDYCPG